MTKHKKKNGVTKVISLKKVLANRANAKKSTGPVTFKGKSKVAGNAITHGLSAEKHVIVGENLAEFKVFKDSMFQIFVPEGAYEEEIFIKIVDLKWRLRRVSSIETGIFGNEILEYDADSNKAKSSGKILSSDFTEEHQTTVKKNQSLIGVAFTRDSNAGSSLLKLNTIEGRLISRCQIFEEQYWKIKKNNKKGVKK